MYNIYMEKKKEKEKKEKEKKAKEEEIYHKKFESKQII